MQNAFLVSCVFLLAACGPSEPPVKTDRYRVVTGETMGTYYRVVYKDGGQGDLKAAIDTLLVHLNEKEVSTYESGSLISRFNASAEGVELVSEGGRAATYRAYPHFMFCLDNALDIARVTGGYFDPTIMPLVNYWGFGYTPKKPISPSDSSRIWELLPLVGTEQVQLVEERGSVRLQKSTPGVQLDFSANAKGYGVDAVGELLEIRGIRDYLVEIGGEDRARGRNDRGAWWTIGINTPDEQSAVTDFERIVTLKDYSIATSGNYRNFFEVDGQKVSHIINPKTGFPERRNLLSVSVFAKDCMTADGYATACMVLGTERALALIEELPEIEALLISTDAAGKYQTHETSGLAALVTAN